MILLIATFQNLSKMISACMPVLLKYSCRGTNLWGPFIDVPPVAHRSPPMVHRWPPISTDGPLVAIAKTVVATKVAPMDFPGLSTREHTSPKDRRYKINSC